ncbi:multidrug resistance-associated protein 5 [Tanacetum coccineum]
MIPGTDLHCFDVHNDGYFAHLPLSYVNGVILNMAVPRIPYKKFTEYLEEKYGDYFQETFGRLELYLDHLDMDLSKYLSQAITTEMNACVSKTIGPPKKRYFNDFSMDDMVDWAEMEVEQRGGSSQHPQKTYKGKENVHQDETKGDEARTNTTYNGKENVSQDETEGVKARTSNIDSDYDIDDDSEYVSNKSVDYLSPGEEELIKLRNRMKANREVKAKAKGNSVSEMNKPNDENSMPTDNVRGETFEEHDIYMNGLLTMLKTTHEDGKTEDPFISFEKHMDKYLIPNQGEILTITERDGNNHICLVARVVVNVENNDNLSWFLELLEEDLGCSKGNRLNLMSDQHKCLIEAVKDVMPNAGHMQCARHIYENFRKHYSGLEFRNLFWAASKASYPQLFNKIMDKIKRPNPNAHKYLMDKNRKTWSRTFFEVDRGCETIENGFSEYFNSMTVSVRHKQLLTLLEAIRVIVLERMNKMRKISRKWNPGVCLKIKKILEWLKEQQRFWHAIPAGGNILEVRSGSRDGNRSGLGLVLKNPYPHLFIISKPVSALILDG